MFAPGESPKQIHGQLREFLKETGPHVIPTARFYPSALGEIGIAWPKWDKEHTDREYRMVVSSEDESIHFETYRRENEKDGPEELVESGDV